MTETSKLQAWRLADRSDRWIAVGLAGAAAGLPGALAIMQAGGSSAMSYGVLAASAVALSVAGGALARRRRTAPAGHQPALPEAAAAPAGTAPSGDDLVRLAGALSDGLVFAADRLGRVTGVPAGAPLAMGEAFLDHVNVADRPALLMALDAGSPAPVALALRLRPFAGRAAGDAAVTVVSCGDIRFIRIAEPAAAANAARFAHDVRAPLAAVAGLADALADAGSATDAMRRDYPALIARAARDAVALADAWLGDAAACDAEADTVEQVLATLEQRSAADLGRAGAGLYLRCPTDAGRASVDRRVALEILTNLVSNAIRHGGPDLSIEVGARLVGGQVRFHVRDNGRGLSLDAARDIGVRGVPGAGGSGHGLGLGIVERLARGLGGSVSFETAPGRGLLVAVTLPCRDAGTAILHPSGPPARDDHRTHPQGGPHAPLKRTA